MNWGWGGNYDDVAYSPSGTWTADGEDYISNKRMIYSFSISQ